MPFFFYHTILQKSLASTKPVVIIIFFHLCYNIDNSLMSGELEEGVVKSELPAYVKL